MLENIILGYLMKSDKTGYDIKNYIAESTANFYDIGFGSIYPMLKKLEEKGYIRSREVIDKGRYKKVYSINDPGKNVFLTWLEQPVELPKTKNEHLIKIFFYQWLPKEKAHSLLAAFLDAAAGNLVEIEKIRAGAQDTADLYQMSTLKFAKGYFELIVAWCRDILAELDQTIQKES